MRHKIYSSLWPEFLDLHSALALFSSFGFQLDDREMSVIITEKFSPAKYEVYFSSISCEKFLVVSKMNKIYCGSLCGGFVAARWS